MTTAGEAWRAMRTLPRGGVSDIIADGTPVILAPHPDDEVIGCGALIAAAAASGLSPVILYVTDGSGSHPHSRKFPRNELIVLRQREAYTAAEILGVDPARIYFLGIKDTAAPHNGPAFAQAVGAIVETISSCHKPVIFAPWHHDPHGDHQAVYKMALLAGRMLMARHLSYLVWGWTLPEDQELADAKVAGWRFAVDGGKDRKSRALEAYQSQVSNLIDDDPAAFRLDGETLRMMLSDDEVFLVNS